jgi:hypothetical protein
MRIFGCPDCASADEEPKTQPMITKGKMNFLKTLMLVEQNETAPVTLQSWRFGRFIRGVDRFHRLVNVFTVLLRIFWDEVLENLLDVGRYPTERVTRGCDASHIC